jgi:RND family efflux transporter MFP subunit
MSKTIWMFTAVCLAVAALLFTASCSRSTAMEPVTASADSRPAVPVARAAQHELSRTMVLTGEFLPFQEVDVMAKVAGYVKKISVDIGDRVGQGQLLAVLEVPEMTDDLTRAAAAIERNTAEVARAHDELRRAQSAHEMAHLSYTRLFSVIESRPGLVAQQEIDDAHSRDLVSEAQVSAAQSALAAAEQQVKVAQAEQARYKTLFNYTTVTAPFAGVVTKRYADTGSMIQAGTASQTQAMPLVRLSENSLLRLILPVPESAVPRVRVGESVEVSVPSLGRTFPGKVARFADKLDVATRTMATEVDVPNPQLTLVPGMFAKVDLNIERSENAVAVPATAVVTENGNSSVYAIDASGRLEARNVSVGIQTANEVEIRSGVKPGELVLIGSRSLVKPGEAVSPKMTELVAASGE